jgi:gamma-glutamyltranspeptidase/glutathione hydrolase
MARNLAWNGGPIKAAVLASRLPHPPRCCEIVKVVHESVKARRGMVAAPHVVAAQAGRDVLAEGGNALEAAVAAAAAIVVAYPHMNHLGGDGFWLFREPSGKVRYIEAAGYAGARATQAFYRERGHEKIPERGPLAALTVPGAVGGWMLALEAARALGGRMPLRRLLEPAIALARAGTNVSRSQAWRFTTERGAAIEAPGFAATYLVDGKPPSVGTVLPTGRLADTFEQLARAGLDDFYRGEVGREIAADLEKIGSPITRADLDRYRAVWREPLTLRLRAGTLHNSPPPTQGLVALLILGVHERLGIGEAEGFDHLHGLIEATKRAFRVRDRAITDFDRLKHDPSSFLAAEALDGETRAVDRTRAAPWPEPAGKGDTVWLGAADAAGLVVSYIQSLFWEFGSGCVLPRTGIVMQNRGSSFSLDPKALNPLEPGRRPFHTLTPALAVLADGRVMAYGTMGGEGQPQTQAAVFTRHVMYGVPLGEAIDRPRWILGRTWGSTVTNVRLESRFAEGVVARLRQAGHPVEVLADAYTEVMGHAGAVVRHPDGTLEGGHDPRSDGGAVGV